MYAVISDIHGNLEALEAVLRDVPDGIERIYCLGDVVGYGANPNECCSLVRSYEMPSISGNHDLAVTDLSTDLASARYRAQCRRGESSSCTVLSATRTSTS
jgi:predicted phosphodiesterase